MALHDTQNIDFPSLSSLSTIAQLGDLQYYVWTTWK